MTINIYGPHDQEPQRTLRDKLLPANPPPLPPGAGQQIPGLAELVAELRQLITELRTIAEHIKPNPLPHNDIHRMRHGL